MYLISVLFKRKLMNIYVNHHKLGCKLLDNSDFYLLL